MSRPTTFCEVCGEYVEWHWRTDGLKVLVHISGDGTVIDRAHAAKLDQRGHGDYSDQPRRGDVLENGRYGYVTVVAVHDRGVRLEVETPAHGRQTITRNPAGTWWRLAKAAR